MRRLAAIGIALGLVLGVAPQVQADSRVLVVRGDHSAVIDVVFAEDFQLPEVAIEIRGGGPWAGLIMEPLTAQSPFGFLAAVRVPFSGEHVSSFAGTRQFDAGRYRVRLLTDRAVTFTIQVTTGGRVLQPTRPIAVTARSGRQAVAAGLSEGSVALRGAVPAGRHAVLAYQVSGLHVTDTQVCLNTTPECESPTPGLLIPDDVSDSTAVIWGIPPTRAGRSAVLSSEGVRVEAGALQLFSLAYA